jgi:hypothetical protein
MESQLLLLELRQTFARSFFQRRRQRSLQIKEPKVMI